MTIQMLHARDRRDRLAAGSCVSRVVECAGYLADESVFNLVRDGIAGVMAERAIAAPVYVCHSLGCFVGLDAASREADAIVIAINMPASPWHGFRRACITAARMTQIASTQGIAEATIFRDSWVYFGRPGIDDLSRQRLKHIHRQTNCYATPRRQDTALFLKTVMLEHRPKGPHLPRVLLVQGDHDTIAPAHHANLLRKRLPHSVLVSLKGGHVLPVTHPQEVVREVDRFLSMN
ncbi:pimeloyl-ACP methyl ester carboxylesterase [Pseudorhodoplanes sinuspersici]|nr:pimeloyl-ACP methyl ester carboxylesterase [Pseudorhodoplanes sinuspersici]